MLKSKKSSKSTTTSSLPTLPHAPIIYINGPPSLTATTHLYTRPGISQLLCLLPHGFLRSHWECPSTSSIPPTNLNTTFTTEHGYCTAMSLSCFIQHKKETLGLIIDYQDAKNHVEKIKYANRLSREAVQFGRSFYYVNLFDGTSDGEEGTTPCSMGAELDRFAFPRLDVDVRDAGSAGEVAEGVLRALLKTLPPMETLYLITHAQLRERDTKNFANYAYCPINEVKKRKKDEQIQIVAVVVSKPVISPEGNKLTWVVADKTGVANFYFQNRAPSSLYTWNWVLALEPGQRVALPRMPCVKVKEATAKRILKAPFRLVGGTISVAGHVVKGVGHGVVKVGEVMKMGKSVRWVPEADFEEEQKAKAEEQSKGKGGKVKVWDEKGNVDVKCEWESGDEDARTEEGSVCEDEKKAASFV